MRNMNAYSDMLTAERPIPSRPRMPRQNRAKIFAPYDALKGFEETVHAKDRIFVYRAELSEEVQEQLDLRLRRLRRNDRVTVTWFRLCPESGDPALGEYETASGAVTGIDPVRRCLLLGRRVIRIADITEIRG